MATAGVVGAIGGLLYLGALPRQWDNEFPGRLWRTLTSAAATSAALVKSADAPGPPVEPAAAEAENPEATVRVPKELPEPEPRNSRDSKPESLLPAAAPAQSAPKPREAQQAREGREVVVRPGDTLSALVIQVYGRADLTLLDFAAMANPDIQDIDRLQVGQRLRFPEFQPWAMVRQRDGSRYWLHLTTVWNTEEPAYRKLHAALGRLGREVYVVPVSLTKKDAAYRVMVGDFADRRQAETFYQEFRPPAEVTTQLWR